MLKGFIATTTIFSRGILAFSFNGGRKSAGLIRIQSGQLSISQYVLRIEIIGRWD
jgi:hypothetical protein